jgi:hypothetical protein
LEKQAIEKGVNELAEQIIKGFDEARQMPSPYTPEMAKEVYRAARLLPGSRYDQLVTEETLAELIQRLEQNGTL